MVSANEKKWRSVSRRPGDPDQVLGRVDYGKFMVMLDRGDYWQCAYVIRKGGFDTLQQAGIATFRTELTALLAAIGLSQKQPLLTRRELTTRRDLDHLRVRAPIL